VNTNGKIENCKFTRELSTFQKLTVTAFVYDVPEYLGQNSQCLDRYMKGIFSGKKQFRTVITYRISNYKIIKINDVRRERENEAIVA
jgi:hypothetical protein